MDTKRKACYLLVMLLMDSFVLGSQQQVPPRRVLGAGSSTYQSATQNSSSTADAESEAAVAAITQYVMNNSANASEAHEIVDEIERIVAESLLTNRTFYYEILQSALEEGGLVGLQTDSTKTCSQLKDDIMAALDSDVPVASELTSISLLLAFASKNCNDETLEVFNKLESTFGGPEELLDLILEYVDGVQGEAEVDPVRPVADLVQPEAGLHGPGGVRSASQHPFRTGDVLERSSTMIHRSSAENIVQLLAKEARDMQPFITGTSRQSAMSVSRSLSGGRRRRSTEQEHKIVLYEHVNFKGQVKTFDTDDYLVEFVGYDFNDVTSSLYCSPTPCSVVAFQHRDFDGFQVAFENSTSTVGKHYNDHISSLVFLPFSLSELCLQVTYAGLFTPTSSETVCGDSILSTIPFFKRIVSLELQCTECSIILYKNLFYGHFKSFSSSVKKLDSEWSLARSVQIRPWVYEQYEGEITFPPVFYQHNGFEGRSDEWEGKVDWVGDDLNDEYSSFQCFGTCSVLAFEHRNLEGKSQLFYGTQSSLPDFNDIISSLLVLPYKVCVTLYEHSYYQGRSHRRCSDMKDMSSTGLEDKVSSLKVECDSCSVIIYQHRNYVGRYKSFNGHVSFLGREWNDIASSLRIRPWELNVEGKCQPNPREAKAYSIIQWIPIVSTLYSLASSIAYAAKGCRSVAKDRAKNMAIDLALDTAMAVATVLTAGTATAGVYAVKEGIKSGVKAGVKAFAKASVAFAKTQIKTTVKTITKKSMKTTLKTTVKAVKSAKNLPKQLKNIGQEVVKNAKTAANRGVKQTVQNLKDKVTKSVRSKIDELYDNADKAIKGTDNGRVNVARPRCRRATSVDGCTIPGYKDKIPERFRQQFQREYDALDEAAKRTIAEDEFLALKRYVEEPGHYKRLNNALRTGDNLGDFEDDIKLLNHYLNRADKVTGEILTRYEPYWPGAERFYAAADDAKEIHYPLFVSTSRSKTLSPDRIPLPPPKLRKKPNSNILKTEVIDVLDNPTGPPYLVQIKLTDTTSGVSVQKFSKYKAQDEVLFPSGSKFQVERVAEEWKHVTIPGRGRKNKHYMVLEIELRGVAG